MLCKTLGNCLFGRHPVHPPPLQIWCTELNKTAGHWRQPHTLFKPECILKEKDKYLDMELYKDLISFVPFLKTCSNSNYHEYNALLNFRKLSGHDDWALASTIDSFKTFITIFYIFYVVLFIRRHPLPSSDDWMNWTRQPYTYDNRTPNVNLSALRKKKTNN